MDAQEYKKLAKQPKNKYNNAIALVDGIKFHSKKEAARYQVLKSLQACGEIRKLELQTRFQFNVNGQLLRYPDGARGRKGKPVEYRSDFRYEQIDKKLFVWRVVVEDVKSPASRTPAFLLKAALMLACFGIKILET
jgi:hypothetical protein